MVGEMAAAGASQVVRAMTKANAMTTEIETAPGLQTGAASGAATTPARRRSAPVNYLRDYGLVLALIAMALEFFQVTTSGTLFKPVNLSNLVQQNSFIIVMALGMLLVIVRAIST